MQEQFSCNEPKDGEDGGDGGDGGDGVVHIHVPLASNDRKTGLKWPAVFIFLAHCDF